MAKQLFPQLTVTNVQLDSVSPHPRNARKGSVADIATSLQLHGQYRPIVVQKSTGFILAGNHTWRAAQSLGWAVISATLVDVDDEEAVRILLADNRLADLGGYDEEALVALLQELAQEGSLEGTGYTAEDLASLERLVEALGQEPLDPYAEWTGLSDYESEDKQSVFHVTVHFPSDQAADDFFALLASPKKSTMWWPRRDGFITETVKEHYVSTP